MKWLRALLYGVLLWVLIFFEVSILMFGFNLQEGVVYYIVHYILLILFVILCSFLYFRAKTKSGFGKGFLLGIIFVVVGIILDSVITIPLWILPQGVSYAGFLLDPLMLVGYGVVIVVCGVVGGLKKK